MIQNTSSTTQNLSNSPLPSAPGKISTQDTTNISAQLSDQIKPQQVIDAGTVIYSTQEALAILMKDIQELEALIRSMEDLRQKLLNQLKMIKALMNGNAIFSTPLQSQVDSIKSKLLDTQDKQDKIDEEIKASLRIEAEIAALIDKLQDIKAQMLKTSNEQQLNQLYEKIKIEATNIRSRIANLHSILKKKKTAATAIDLVSIEAEINTIKAQLPTPTPINLSNSTLDFDTIQAALFSLNDGKKLDEAALRAYFKNLCDQITSRGLKEIILSFAQSSDLDDLLQGGSSSHHATDTSAILNVLTDIAHINDITVTLAPNSKQIINPNEEASIKWSALIQKYSFDAIHFDLESSLFISQNKEFLTHLQEQLEAQEKKMAFTVK